METTTTLEDKLKSYFSKWPGETHYAIVGCSLMYCNESMRVEQRLRVKSDMSNYFNLYADFYRTVKEWLMHVEFRVSIIKQVIEKHGK
jgi:hypothetical protein